MQNSSFRIPSCKPDLTKIALGYFAHTFLQFLPVPLCISGFNPDFSTKSPFRVQVNAKTPALMTKTLKASKAKFPAIQASKVEGLPGLGKLGNEAQAWIVTQSGAEVISGSPDIATEWQKVVEANK